MRFDSLTLHPATLAALDAMGFEEATPVQAETLPLLLAGRDIVAQAQTGTGKTAAFGIPLIEAGHKGRRGLVLAPTRELAQQVQRELQAIAHGSPVDVICLIGGANFYDQVKAIKRHPGAVIVATPGRIVDHLGRGTLDLAGINILVLDEADEMLSMGFQEALDTIVAALPMPRQTMLFTATLAQNIERLAQRALVDPITVRAGPRASTAAGIKQSFAIVPQQQRAAGIRRILAVEQPKAALVFCRTRERVETLGNELQALHPEVLHGGMGQPQRDAALQRFRSGRTNLLVATDVAARGLDIQEIELVIHDDLAADTESYIHRTGRTGRAGRLGQSILLIGQGSVRRVSHLQQIAGKIERYLLPDDAALARAQAQKIVDQLAESEPTGEAEVILAAAESSGMPLREIALRALQRFMAPIEAAAQAAANAPPATIALSLKIGAVDGLRPGDVMGMLINEGGIQSSAIGRIDILPQITMVEVPEPDAVRLVGALHQAQFRNRRVMPRVAEDWQFKPTMRR